MSGGTKQKLLVGLSVLLAAILIFATSCVPEEEPEEEMDYTQYSVPEFGVTFEYPEGWRLVEWDLESAYSGVYEGGISVYTEYSENLTEPIAVALILWIVPAVEQGGNLTTVDEYVAHTIVQRSIGTTTVISDDSTTIAGQSAREVNISYSLLLPPKSLTPKLITCITTWAVFKKDGYFYDLQFGAGEADYDDFFEKVYEHAKETISFAS